MNILNIVIIVFLLGMAYWWSSQGLFSSLIHLCAVIVAGALAFALWEVFALDVMMRISPSYAWTAGLLAPFIVLLLILRLVSDRYLMSNVHFSQIINMIGGGILGIGSGILTAGILIIGISFLPLGPSLLGYQPLLIEEDGQVRGEAGDSLLVPVDKQAAGFFTMLSSGAFTSDHPIRVYQPELAQQAALYRMSYDPNSSLVADPNHVQATAFIEAPTPLRDVEENVVKNLGDTARQAGNKLVIIDTRWKQLAGVFDGDSTLRISPTQIRLVATDAHGHSSMIAPMGASQDAGGQRRFTSFKDNRTLVWSDSQDVSFAWLFVIKETDRPRFLMVRHLRLDLPEAPTGKPEDARAMAGSSPDTSTVALINEPGDKGPTPMAHTGPNTGQAVLDISVTDQLPLQISKNMVQGFNYEGSGIISGEGTVGKMTQSATKEVLLDHINTPSHRHTLRVLLDRESANSIFGAVRVAAAQVNGIWLVDSNGDKWYPVGFVLERSNGDQKIKIDLGAPLQSAKELPLGQIQSGDKLYLYFSVSKGVTIISYNVGSQVTSLNLAVPN